MKVTSVKTKQKRILKMIRQTLLLILEEGKSNIVYNLIIIYCCNVYEPINQYEYE